MNPLPISSHVARSRDDKGNKIPIVRQSMPFGNLKGPHGLLFIAYANTPKKFDVVSDFESKQANLLLVVRQNDWTGKYCE